MVNSLSHFINPTISTSSVLNSDIYFHHPAHNAHGYKLNMWFLDDWEVAIESLWTSFLSQTPV